VEGDKEVGKMSPLVHALVQFNIFLVHVNNVNLPVLLIFHFSFR